MTYPREIYKSGQYRVIWGMEEHAALKREGWSDERQEVSRESSAELTELAEPKRRGRPPRVQSITEVA